MHGQIMNGSDSVVVFGIINITKCFKYMNSCPGLWHALEQWDNLHYHNVLLELFFPSNTLPYAKQMDIHDFTDEI